MKKVVILGGGFAGTTAAKELENDFDVTLIDTKNYFEYTPAILRVIVEPEHIEKIEVLHKDYLKNSKFVKGRATSVKDSKVKLKNGETYNYDYLIIAIGSRYRELFKAEDVILSNRGKIMREAYERLQNAKDILIIGGGLVGVELAAELVKYDKNLTLVHSKNRLLERNPVKASKYAEKFLKKRGVKIIFEERAKEKDGKNYTTDKGRKIKADLTFSCTGIISNGDTLKGLEVDERGSIPVNEFLQVSKNIFAVGDVTSIKEEKTAQNADRHGELIARNIRNLENKKPLEKYDEKPGPLVISLGKYDGLIVKDNLVITGKIPAFLKASIEWKVMRKY